MNELELKLCALDGLKYLRLKSKSFNRDLLKIKRENKLAIDKLNDCFKANRMAIMKSDGKRLAIPINYFKGTKDKECKKLFADIETFQNKFHLKGYPFDLLVELPVLNHFSYKPVSFTAKIDITNVTLKIDIQADISKDEFDSIWPKVIKPFKKFAKKYGFKTQDGSKDFDLAFIFYEAKCENPHLTNSQLADHVANKIAKPLPKSIANQTTIKKLKRNFTEQQASSYVRRAKNFIEGLSLLFSQK